MDISDSLAPTSDQLDAIELVAGPRTFTVASVSKGTPEQPIDVHLAEFPRVWRPSKGMRRALAAGWGVNAAEWAGRRVTLFFDPNVSFGKERTGGTRIAAMSNLPGGKRLSIPMTVTRGKSTTFTIEPLPDAAPAVTAEQVAASTDPAELRSWWKGANPQVREQIRLRVEALTKPAETVPAASGDDRADEAAQLFADQP
jgi:hypothetical protein